jgi:murein hydrolase activator
MASRFSRSTKDTKSMQARKLLILSCISCISWFSCPLWLNAQTTDRAKTEAMARRVNERMRALQREADRLAGEARTLLGDMRRLEIERDLAAQRVIEADVAVANATADLEVVTERIAALDQQRTASLPDLKARFVELYKNRRGSYARMLIGVRDLREFGRATRAVASLAHLNRQRIDDHRRTVASLRKERTTAEQRARELEGKQAAARTARVAAERAVRARATLMDQIDRRRDLNAQLTGELQLAQQKLEAALTNLRSGQTVEAVPVPLLPFRGALDWPVVGRLVGRFGQSNRMTSAGVRNGIEIAAPEGTPVRAVHPGTVGFADAFTGYGTLVIVDHGANQYSLYGYLSSASVTRGQRVNAGDELGGVGVSPAGDTALYYEMRVDGRSVDPVQWLKKR